MRKYSSVLAALLAMILISVCSASAALRIVEPPPGSAFYIQEDIPLRAELSGQSATEGLRFVWSTAEQGDFATGLAAVARNLSYRTHRLTVRAMSGDSLVSEAATDVTILVRPSQFTLSERNDWHGEVSPRGTAIAFTSWRSGNPEVWTAGLDGRGARQITRQGGWAPSWSNDGRSIVFWSERAGKRDLWLIEMGGGQLAADRLTPGDGFDWMPACSPIDTRVVYCSKRGPRLSLKVLDHAAFDRHEALEVVGPEHHPMFPRWFPNGEELLFTSYSDTLPFLCRVSLLDNRVRRITGHGTEDGDVSPDGRLIVMVRDGELWLHRLEDGAERRLTREGAGALSPRFFPEGSRVLYASSFSGNYDLWILDLPGLD